MVYLYGIRIRILLKDMKRILVVFIIPLILVTLVDGTWSNLSKEDTFERIPVAVVYQESGSRDNDFISTLEGMRGKNKEALFQVMDCSIKEAEYLLQNDTIIGYIIPFEDMKLVVRHSGTEETLLKTILNTYREEEVTNTTFIKDVSKVEEVIGPGVLYFYMIFAMTSLLGSLWGMKEVADVQPYVSQQGIRVAIAPISKKKIFTCNLAAAVTVEFGLLWLLMAYLHVVLGAKMEADYIHLAVLCFLSALLGVSFGTMAGVLLKINENMKKTILVFFSIICSVLAYVEMLDRNSIFGYGNPAGFIIKEIYYLNVNGIGVAYYWNLLLMVVMSILFLTITYWNIRRRSYASI